MGDQLLPPIEFLNCTHCSGLGRARRRLGGRKLGSSPERSACDLETLPTPARPGVPLLGSRRRLGARGAEIFLQTPVIRVPQASSDTETCAVWCNDPPESGFYTSKYARHSLAFFSPGLCVRPFIQSHKEADLGGSPGPPHGADQGNEGLVPGRRTGCQGAFLVHERFTGARQAPGE